MSHFKYKGGFTLIEALAYVAILTIVSIGAVGVLFDLDDLFFQYQVKQELFVTGSAAMERILTELRQAESVDLGESAFATSTAGKLGLDSGATTTIFTLANDAVSLTVNGQPAGELATGNVMVEGFTVYRYALTQGELIRVRLALRATVDESSDSLVLYGAAVIRGSYQ